MAVSRRLRFEVLKRDRHRCFYCGQRAPDIPLTVDHVIPAALGGTDDPSNLVAACADCNGGKSSVHPNSEVVADVDRRALLWAAAIKVLAEQRSADRDRRSADCKPFLAWWREWKVDATGQPVPIPADWQRSVEAWLAAGLVMDVDDLVALIPRAMNSKARADQKWKYFCGCAWRTVDEVRSAAYDLADAAAVAWDDEEAMV